MDAAILTNGQLVIRAHARRDISKQRPTAFVIPMGAGEESCAIRINHQFHLC